MPFTNMFEKLKNFFSGVGLVVKYGDVIRGILSAWNSFPGLENPETLRKWIKPLLIDASTLALVTKTSIDDAIVFAALRIVDNDRAWTAVHALALLVRDGGLFKDGVLIPENMAYSSYLNELNDAVKSTLPDSPILIHAAVGLILFILQKRFTKI